MELTSEEITKLAFIRLALSEFIELLESHGGIKGNRLVFYVKEGWEAEIINVTDMERGWFEKHQREHGEDERKSSQGE